MSIALNLQRTRVLSSLLVRKNNYFTYSNQISQPMERTPEFVSAQEAVKCIKSGEFIASQLPGNPLDIIKFSSLHHGR